MKEINLNLESDMNNIDDIHIVAVKVTGLSDYIGVVSSISDKVGFVGFCTSTYGFPVVWSTSMKNNIRDLIISANDELIDVKCSCKFYQFDNPADFANWLDNTLNHGGRDLK